MTCARSLGFLFVVFVVSVDAATEQELKKFKNKAYQYHEAKRIEAWGQCCVSQSPARGTEFVPVDAPKIIQSTGRGRRDAASNTAVLLTSNIGVMINEDGYDLPHIPHANFSVELWVKPEGGQTNPAIILKAEDLCSPFENKGWSLGIKMEEKHTERNARYFFSLGTAQSYSSTELFAPFNYNPGEWTHLAITYNRDILYMYINGAQVAASRGQKGDVFSPEKTNSCFLLHLGGFKGRYFRGAVDNLRIWNRTLSHREVRERMVYQEKKWHFRETVLGDAFDTLGQWEWDSPGTTENHSPKLIASDIPRFPAKPKLHPPPCGFTLCDVPDIIRSYESNWELQLNKKVRYRIINVHNSDGSNPTVTQDQIAQQHQALQQAFFPYNISWELYQESVYDSALRTRTVIFGCSPSKIGNSECNPECQLSITGNDGGDCDREPSMCEEHKKGNGICDSECNQFYNDWDGGDCCHSGRLDNLQNCLDPESPHRIYVDIEEYKSLLNFTNSHHLNILFAHWENKDVMGIATFPWEKLVYSAYGGIVVKPDDFGVRGKLETVIHEVGHVLGLWHIHHGVTELDCHDQCFEREARMDVGDLCGDTNPTPQNSKCQDPSHEVERCGISEFINTPFTNYMSYTECPQDFTKQQVARMHCYIDLKYQRWKADNSYPVPPPPLSPMIASSTKSSITLTWLSPLANIAQNGSDCSMCTKDLELIQFAEKAESNGIPFTDFWQPSQATGLPDAEVCTPSDRAWSPYPGCSECILTLSFKVPVIPTLLSVWVTWNAKNGLKEIEITFTDDSSMSVFDQKLYCDVPLTIPLFVEKKLKMVRLKSNSSNIAVDAVQVISAPNEVYCAPCKPLRYRVYRSPPFSAGESHETDEADFTDSEVRRGELLTYRVQAWVGSYSSPMSPPLIFQHEDNFCGDGKIRGDEQCDDGNNIGNDGCSMKCAVEKHYKCHSEPSLCYWYDGDGTCEEFEKHSSIKDCGFHTPANFKDQWAVTAETSFEFFSNECPPDVVTGPPTRPEVCGPELDATSSWYPCEGIEDTKYWISVSFPEPVIATSVFLYIASDAQLPYEATAGQATVSLLDNMHTVHYSKNMLLSCLKNPYEVPVIHDLSKQFHLTSKVNITFTTSSIAIAAVQLRSANYLNPVSLSQCSYEELYSPLLQKCVAYACKKPRCPKPISKNSYMTCNGYEEGHTCTVECKEGHIQVSKANNITCINGEWHGDLNCKPLDCRAPMIAHADAICPHGTTVGKICNFKCRPPARLKGSARMATVQCQTNGYWSTPKAQCQLTCISPLSQPHADHAVLESKNCHHTDSILFGHRCRFRCKTGYHVKGQSIRRIHFYLLCGDNGSWYGQSCAPITCSDLGMFSHYSCTNGLHVGSECKAQCLNQVNSSRCALDGHWYPPLRFCSDCSIPKTPSKGVQITNGSLSDGMYNVSCKRSDKEVVLQGEKVPVEKVTCMEKGTWHPDPRLLTCKKRSGMRHRKHGMDAIHKL